MKKCRRTENNPWAEKNYWANKWWWWWWNSSKFQN